jgi:hypothetical protein
MKTKIFNAVIITLVLSAALTLPGMAKQSSEMACQPGDGICSVTTDGNGDMHVHPGRLVFVQNQ